MPLFSILRAHGSPVFVRARRLPGAAAVLLALIGVPAGSAAHAQAYILTTLAVFNGENGAYPNGTLAIDAGGNLYGTTGRGRPLPAKPGDSGSYGTVFRVDARTRALKTRATFHGTDGAGPSATATTICSTPIARDDPATPARSSGSPPVPSNLRRLPRSSA